MYCVPSVYCVFLCCLLTCMYYTCMLMLMLMSCMYTCRYYSSTFSTTVVDLELTSDMYLYYLYTVHMRYMSCVHVYTNTTGSTNVTICIPSFSYFWFNVFSFNSFHVSYPWVGSFVFVGPQT